MAKRGKENLELPSTRILVACGKHQMEITQIPNRILEEKKIDRPITLLDPTFLDALRS